MHHPLGIRRKYNFMRSPIKHLAFRGFQKFPGTILVIRLLTGFWGLFDGE